MSIQINDIFSGMQKGPEKIQENFKNIVATLETVGGELSPRLTNGLVWLNGASPFDNGTGSSSYYEYISLPNGKLCHVHFEGKWGNKVSNQYKLDCLQLPKQIIPHTGGWSSYPIGGDTSSAGGTIWTVMPNDTGRIHAQTTGVLSPNNGIFGDFVFFVNN